MEKRGFVVTLVLVFAVAMFFGNGELTGQPIVKQLPVVNPTFAGTSSCGDGTVDKGESCDTGSLFTVPDLNCPFTTGGQYPFNFCISYTENNGCQCLCGDAVGAYCPTGFYCDKSLSYPPYNICQPIVCGDDHCADEEIGRCALDCFVTTQQQQGNPLPTMCGNGICEIGENDINCVIDCPVSEGETFYFTKFDATLPSPGFSVSGVFGSFNQRFAKSGQQLFVGIYDDDDGDGLKPFRAKIMESDDAGETWSIAFDDWETSQPPVLATDYLGRIHAMGRDTANGNCVRHLRFDPFQGNLFILILDTCMSNMGSKWSMKYNPVYDVLHFSRRYNDPALNSPALNVLTVDTNGNFIDSSDIALSASLGGGVNINAHRHGLAVDESGNIHLIYNTQTDPGQSNDAVLYLRSNNVGDMVTNGASLIWRKSDNSIITTPYPVNNYQGFVCTDTGYPGAEIMSCNVGGAISSLLVTDSKIHMTFSSGGNIHYVRKDLTTGDEEIRVPLTAGAGLDIAVHNFLIEDTLTGDLYIVGASSTIPECAGNCLRILKWDNTDVLVQNHKWIVLTDLIETEVVAGDPEWDRTSGFPRIVTLDGKRYIIIASSDVQGNLPSGQPGGVIDAYFFKYRIV